MDAPIVNDARSADAGDPATGSPGPSTAGARRRLALVFVVAAALLAVSLRLVAPPDALPADAPAESFSATRAMEHVRRLASAPRPAGSLANVAARDALLVELDALGLATRRQEGRSGDVPLVNVLAERPGTDSTGAILLLAHHDSVGSGPGAADDASGCAVILETLRALAGEPLRNDVLVVLTDGEERGLLGARLFAQDPWVERVDVVLNVEARGGAGPSILFETGPDSGGLVDVYGAVAPHPFATSLGPAVYERMPNDTDFTVLQERGVRGLNFAFLGGASVYHRPQDTAENLDPGSVQHHGANLLALVRALGAADLGRIPGGTRTFFGMPGVGTLRYDSAWDVPLAVVASLLVVVALAAARRRLGLSDTGVLAGLAAVPLVVVAVVGAGFGIVAAARWGATAAGVAGPVRSNLPSSLAASAGVFLLAFGAGLLLLGRRPPAARRSAPVDGLQLAAGAQLLLIAAAWIALRELPGAAFLPTWCALVGALSLLLEVLGAPRVAWVIVAALVGLVLLPVQHLLVLVGSVKPPTGVLLGGFVAALGLIVAAPRVAHLADTLTLRSRWLALLPGTVVLVGAGVLAIAGR